MANEQITAEQFASKTYDFVIIGGGTAGLVLAARLTEDPSVSVGVIEAGENRSDDPLIQIPGFHAKLYDDPKYDWTFKTVPQKHVLNDVHGWPRSRVLGGSSAINYSMYSQASKRDIDNWEALGNPGWTWDNLLPYYKKHETYTAPEEPVASILGAPSTIDPSLHGTNGPIQTSFPPIPHFVQEVWFETCKNMGLPAIESRTGASVSGLNQLLMMDAKTGTRSYATTGYYFPNAKRPNLSVLTASMANNILLEKKDGKVIAAGVEFTTGGSTHTVRSTREVLLCAGVIQSPQLLELSGVGSKKLLEGLGIEVMVDNPGVGENLQDHLIDGACFQTEDGVVTLDYFRDSEFTNKAVVEFMTTGKGMFTSNSITGVASVPYLNCLTEEEKTDAAEQVNKLVNLSELHPGLAKQHQILKEMLLNPSDTALCLVPSAGGATLSKTEFGSGLTSHDCPDTYFGLVANLQHPFSRGTVHIKSKDVNEQPEIDPAYLSHPLDLIILEKGMRHIKQWVQTEPLASKLKNKGTVLMPGNEHFAAENWTAQVKQNLGTQWHPLGTCSMLPRADGGVVDHNLKVYGVENLRVVDASVFPLHVQGNICSLVYAVAERAADLIKGKANVAA
ncbi:hypothetical protein F5884DRAFT_663223 [Xylogone sp. PMI_703]|nr:hypothetical protein F5884DRAFT_663223 [Xylogone sp. PMI_703]